ncbi:MAG: hypothetical protein J6T15_04880 [Bacilli bacterium]|nr:hypothetical protein [Bacilli bacterium]
MEHELRYGLTVPYVREKGVYSGTTYYIVEGYLTPTAYIVIPKKIGLFKKHPFYKSKEEMPYTKAPGGITYVSDDFYIDCVGKDNFVIGWDYAHFNNYLYFEDPKPPAPSFWNYNEGHKVTLEEVRRDVEKVIDYVKGVEKRYEKSRRNTKDKKSKN